MASRASRSSDSPFLTSLLHQSVTRGMSGRDRGMSMREGGWVERKDELTMRSWRERERVRMLGEWQLKQF